MLNVGADDHLGKPIKVYHASSSECFGDLGGQSANEAMPFRPRSPYAVAKASAHWLVANYRDAYGLFASNGILFNHESPLRPGRFVTQKIVSAAVRIAGGARETLTLGRLDIVRDWGWAPEYVEAMWRMLQQDRADDYVIGTGEPHSVREFVEEAFRYVGLDWRDHVVIDPKYFRPTEVDELRADCRHARERLGWSPRIGFSDLVKIMVDQDLGRAKHTCPGDGFRILVDSGFDWLREA